MARNLIICCDGTSNEFGRENTNVVRLIQSLDRDPTKQRLYYDPGVGTLPEPGTWSKIGKGISDLLGLAIGAGLTWKVEQAYTFLTDLWEPGDRVYMFGFSRGAYTVRVLAGILHILGLLPRGGHNMVPYAMRLFKAIRGDDGDPSKAKYWKLCDEFRWTFARPIFPGDEHRHFRTHFLGLWDTVSSVGWVWEPAKFQFTARNPSVDVIRHAVSIDERRCFFRQNLMQSAADTQNLKQYWFPGVHCDIGGGYPEKYSENPDVYSRLWRISFEWILNEAHSAGLHVDPERLKIVLGKSPPVDALWKDPQHESLTKLWWLAEFFPKWVWHADRQKSSLELGLGRNRYIKDGQLIHQSALNRLREMDYAPRNMGNFIQKVTALSTVPETMPFEWDQGATQKRPT